MAGQFDDAFSPPRMQCWTVPRTPPKRPSPRPPTAFIADDRGHLLPQVRRSQVSPWGTFVGTWDLPCHLPPPWLDLSSRSPGPAQRLLRAPAPALRQACNGPRTCVTGQLQEPWDTEPSGKDLGGPNGGSPSPETPNPEDNPEGGPCPQNPPGPGGPCPLSPPCSGGPCPLGPHTCRGPCPLNPPCFGGSPSS